MSEHAIQTYFRQQVSSSSNSLSSICELEQYGISYDHADTPLKTRESKCEKKKQNSTYFNEMKQLSIG